MSKNEGLSPVRRNVVIRDVLEPLVDGLANGKRADRKAVAEWLVEELVSDKDWTRKHVGEKGWQALKELVKD